jgi:hypothetical protein
LIQAARLDTGRSAFNVFPLSLIRGKWDNEQAATIPMPGAQPQEPKGPFLKVPAVLDTKKVSKSNH